MKKNSIADQIEQKIRQINDKYKHIKKSASENIIQAAKSSMNMRNNDIIRNDLKNHLPIIKLLNSRDVSHLKDPKKIRANATSFNLPTDIFQLRKVLDCQSTSLENSMHLCGKSTCIDGIPTNRIDIDIHGIEFLEKIDHGAPSGRKEVENLSSWFMLMKDKYDTDDNFDIVVLACEQELLKQVFVDCKTRGNLLKMILSYYHGLFHRNKETFREAIDSMDLTYEKKLENLKKSYNENLHKSNDKIIELSNSIEKHQNIINQIQDENLFYKKKLHEMQRIYLEEQEMWRKKLMSSMRSNVQKGISLSNDSHSLAILKWKKMLFKSEVVTEENEGDDSIVLPQYLKEKIERGEPLDSEELLEYKEIYEKKQQDLYDKLFQTVETQTEEIEKDFESIHEEHEENLPKITMNFEHTEPVIVNDVVQKIEVISVETQTEDWEDFDESELLKEENSINEEDFEEDNEEDKEDLDEFDENPKETIINNHKASVSSNSSRLPSANGGISDYSEGHYTPLQFRTPIYEEELGRVTESETESDLVNLIEIEEEYPQKKHPRKKKETGITSFTISKEKDEETGINNFQITDDNESQNSIIRAIKKKSLTHKEEEKLRKINQSLTVTKMPNQLKDDSESKNEEEGDIEDEKERSESNIINNNEIQMKATDRSTVNTAPLKKKDQLNNSYSLNRQHSLTNKEKKAVFDQQLIDPKQGEKKAVFDQQLIDPKQGENISNMKKYSKTPLLNSQSISTNIIIEDERRISLPLNLRRASDGRAIIQGKLGKNPKKTTALLMKSIQKKKQELLDLEKAIETKKKWLEGPLSENKDFNHIQSASSSPNQEKTFKTEAILKQLLCKITKKTSGTELNPQSLQLDEQNQLLVEEIVKKLTSIENSKNLKPEKNKQREHRIKSMIIPDIDGDIKLTEDILPDEFDPKIWTNGYAIGYSRGKVKGKASGKQIGKEEGITEGYAKALREIKRDNSFENESESDNNKNTSLNEGNSVVLSQQHKGNTRRPSGFNEGKREITKFSEFKFAKHKSTLIKTVCPALELTKKLFAKSSDYIKKKATISRKMLNKLISNIYQVAYTKSMNEIVEELLIICYEEFIQKYGLKKVADKKYLEFIASLLKNKSHKKCSVFIRLAGLGNINGVENYSKFTLMLYLESLQYMLTSKIGITMNYDEGDDKSLFPINRAIECLKDKLENKIEKNSLMVLVNSLEREAIPDPQRISTGLVGLEFTLSVICDAYELTQKSIKKGVDMIITALGSSENKTILQYDFGLIVRYLAPLKFQRLEGEETLTQELSYEEAYEISVELNILTENEVNNFIKNYQRKPFENYSELIHIIENMEKEDSKWISVSEDEWKKRLSDCMRKWDETSPYAIISWRIYDSELKRINSEFLHA